MVNPVRIPTHYTIMKNVGRIGTEVYITITVTSTANAGQNIVNISSEHAAQLLVGQLICYSETPAVLTSYYTAKIKTVNESSIELEEDLEIQITAGNKMQTFWYDDPHPREFGSYALISYMKRWIDSTSVLGDMHTFINLYGNDLINKSVVVGTGAISSNETNGPSYFGYSGNPEMVVSTSENGDGVYIESGMQSGGRYSYEVVLNPGDSSMDIVVSIGEVTIDTNSFSSSRSCVKVARKTFTTELSGKIKLSITQDNGTSFRICNIRMSTNENISDNINSSTVVLFGDSWINLPWLRNAFEAAYPDATVYYSPHPGYKASSLNNVKNEFIQYSPDYVIVIVGTNDSIGSVPQQTFAENVGKIVSACAKIGAKAIVWDCSTGAKDSGSYEYQITNNSHNLAIKTKYIDDYIGYSRNGKVDNG